MSGCNACTSTTSPPADGRFRRVLWVALTVNAVMFAVEVTAGWISGSMALQADALDFLGDSFNYAVSLLVLPLGLAARARAALVKGGFMAVFGLSVLAVSAWRAFNGEAPDAGIMGAMGFVALAANVGVALMLFRYRRATATCARSGSAAAMTPWPTWR